MDLTKSIGLGTSSSTHAEQQSIRYINLKLAALGCPTGKTDPEFQEWASALLSHHRETERLLANYLCPADWRIQQFLNEHLYDTGCPIALPARTFILDRHGLARTLSICPERDYFISDIVSSYRVKQGVLHNPKSDRRTTEGIVHVAEGGLAMPADKNA